LIKQNDKLKGKCDQLEVRYESELAAHARTLRELKQEEQQHRLTAAQIEGHAIDEQLGIIKKEADGLFTLPTWKSFVFYRPQGKPEEVWVGQVTFVNPWTQKFRIRYLVESNLNGYQYGQSCKYDLPLNDAALLGKMENAPNSVIQREAFKTWVRENCV